MIKKILDQFSSKIIGYFNSNIEKKRQAFIGYEVMISKPKGLELLTGMIKHQRIC